MATKGWIWALLFGLALILKLTLLAIDPNVQFFLGDSYVYLNTAVTGAKPHYQSWVYGLLVGAMTGTSKSLFPTLIAQATAGAMTATLAGWVASRAFRVSTIPLVAVVVLCALDPAQLLFERYVLTETFSLTALALMTASLLNYLHGKGLLWLLMAGVMGVLVVSMRTSLFPMVLICIILSPILLWKLRPSKCLSRVIHLLVALSLGGLVFIPTTSIKTGQFLLAAWSPLLEPNDFPDPTKGAKWMSGKDLHQDPFGRARSHSTDTME